MRVMTYNVHSCIGSDRRVAPERVLAVIEASGAELIALQEVDVEQERTLGVHQAAWLAEKLGMHYEFVAARESGGGHYGNAVLSRYPLQTVRHACLPQLGRREMRAVQWVSVAAPFGCLNLLNTHFGLSLRERALQTETLLGESWLGPAPRKTVLCGDFNARPGSRVHRNLCGVLCDAIATSMRRSLKTWPARWPLFQLDHIFLSRDLRAQRCEVPSQRMERLASDHLPLVVDIEEVPGNE
jgi:endonuclease/exonuclease/phosphatase family metal-dependent hydrolase